MRLFGLTPDQWGRESLPSRTYMLAHYKEHHLRKAHTHHVTKMVAEESAKNKIPKKR